MRLNFIIVGGPCESFCDKCLTSLYEQKFIYDWRAQVMVDPVDSTPIKVIKYASDNVKITINEQKKGGLSNTIQAINLLLPEDDDIMITLDLDDWLTSIAAETIIKEYKENHNLLMTYGSWCGHPSPSAPTNCFPYTDKDWQNIRKAMFRATHLRTFKYKLWKYIKHEDFADDKGIVFPSAWDMSFAIPFLEIAGQHRVKFIDKILYVYNQETQFNDFKLKQQEQLYYTRYIMNKEPYSYKEIL